MRRRTSTVAIGLLLVFSMLLAGALGAGAIACGESAGSPETSISPPTESTATTTEATTASTASTIPPVSGSQFTSEDLARFDGKEGRPAYVAVDGVVYDVSGSAQWPEGEHMSCNLGAMAGRDLSEQITKAPRSMRSLLEAMPVVGSLVE